MKLSFRLMIYGVIGILGAIAVVYAFLPKPISVETAVVQRGTITLTVDEDGKTRIKERYVVSSPVSGRLSRIELHAGDPVFRSKTLLAVIHPSDPAMLDARSRAEALARVSVADASVQRAIARREQAKIAVDLADKKLTRVSGLWERNAIPRDEYESEQANYRLRNQELKAAEFDEEIARFELQMAEAAAAHFKDDSSAAQMAEPFEIRTPVDGKVLRVLQESSTVVLAGTPVMEIGDPKNLEIEVDVLSTDAVKISPGAEVQIEHWGGTAPLIGTVRTVEPAAFTKISSLGVEEQRVNIIIDFVRPDRQTAALGDAFRVEARITVDRRDDAIVIPTSTLFRVQEDWAVFVVEENRAVLTRVELGLRNDRFAEVAAGLRPQQRVVQYPSDQISDGSRLIVTR